MARNPSYAASRAIDRTSGTTAQQRPFAGKRLAAARRGAGPGAAAVLDTLLRWDGNYARTDERGTVPAGVATWEEFKDRAEAIALFSLTKRAAGPRHRRPWRARPAPRTCSTSPTARRSRCGR